MLLLLDSMIRPSTITAASIGIPVRCLLSECNGCHLGLTISKAIQKQTTEIPLDIQPKKGHHRGVGRVIQMLYKALLIHLYGY